MILTNIATNAVRTTLSAQSGDYTFPAVAPGFYNVRVEQPSFKAASSTRSRMVTSVLYEMPVGRGRAIDIKNRVANAVIGGWQTGGTLTLQSDMPTTLGIGGIDNTSTAAGGYDRPNSTGISPCLDHPSLSRCWNLGAFVEAAPGQFGNVGRNAIIGPGNHCVRCRSTQGLSNAIKENHRLQLRLKYSF